ncbi:MAG: DUF86 domain-containing protein [Kiritimatiellaeota bacterium]|nr:DUF86 domain-containing protein [Kiritimatiellota bacterium]
MPHEIAKSLTDALDACLAIRKFTEGRTFQTYLENELLRSAVERKFEILGEAFNRIQNSDPSFRERLPEAGDIIGMRNRVIHGYDSVDDEIVWVAVTKHIPFLTVKISELLENNL